LEVDDHQRSVLWREQVIGEWITNGCERRHVLLLLLMARCAGADDASDTGRPLVRRGMENCHGVPRALLVD
jgi:hypothetical protein